MSLHTNHAMMHQLKNFFFCHGKTEGEEEEDEDGEEEDFDEEEDDEEDEEEVEGEEDDEVSGEDEVKRCLIVILVNNEKGRVGF